MSLRMAMKPQDRQQTEEEQKEKGCGKWGKDPYPKFGDWLAWTVFSLAEMGFSQHGQLCPHTQRLCSSYLCYGHGIEAVGARRGSRGNSNWPAVFSGLPVTKSLL